jgi:uncharacterized protein YkwD
MRALRAIGLAVCAALLFSSWAGTSVVRAAGDVPPYDEGQELALVSLINNARERAGLWPLQRSPALTAAGRLHALDILTSGTPSSIGSDGSTVAQRALAQGFLPYGDPTNPWVYVGESLGMGFGSAQDIFNALSADSTNHDLLFNPAFREVGVGYQANGTTNAWVIDLGSEPKVLPSFLGGGPAVSMSSLTSVLFSDDRVPSWGSPAAALRFASSPDLSSASWQPWRASASLQPACVAPWATLFVEYQQQDNSIVESQNRALCLARPAPLFSDVSAGDSASSAITLLYRLRVIEGYGDGRFGPSDPITRAQAAALLVRSQGWATLLAGAPSFSDVSPNDWSYNFIETARAHGVVNGYTDGTFRPNAVVNRAELAAMAVRAGGWPGVNLGAPRFSDVQLNDSLAPWVNAAAGHGLIQGYAGGSFHPAEGTTRASAALVVARLMLLQVDAPLDPSAAIP